MKKLTTISLFIFGIIVTAIVITGLFFQNNKQMAVSGPGALVSGTVARLLSSGKNVVLNMAEISQHNNQTDCWMLINGKVYDITGYFGKHPGGTNTMTQSCGKDATDAYLTKDPYANNNSGGRSHSSYAQNMLADYYLGDFNQTLK
jgi:cytochrome b involved in lipid metabolism